MSPFRASAPLTSQWRHFQFSVTDGVGTLRLDRPDKLNALTFEAYADLRDLLAELPQQGDTRVLVLRGSAGRGGRRLGGRRWRPAARRRSSAVPGR